MQVLKSISALFLSVTLLPVAGAADQQIGIVNGDPVMKAELLNYARIKNPKADLNNAEVQRQLLQGYVGRELLYQEALAQKLDELETVKLTLDNQRHEILAQALVTKILQENPVTDAEARELYKQQQSGAAKAAEYSTSHILTQTEQQAKQAIDRLNNGESFDKVARNLSTDSSASRGGEIGWINPARMPPGFATALKDTPVGEYTKNPVQTQFGWHVIKVEASRPASVPGFEQVKDQLIQQLAEQKVMKYVAELQKKADIKIGE